jgi:hypothetical protein
VRFSRLLKLAVEVDLTERLVEPIVERIPRPTAEFLRSNPERLLVLLFPPPERHRDPPSQVRSRKRDGGENQHAANEKLV